MLGIVWVGRRRIPRRVEGKVSVGWNGRGRRGHEHGARRPAVTLVGGVRGRRDAAAVGGGWGQVGIRKEAVEEAEVLNDGEGVVPLDLHEARRSVQHSVVESVEEADGRGHVAVLQEPAANVLLKLVLLLFHCRKVDEESAAHVGQHIVHVVWVSHFVAAHEKVAVLEQSTAANLLRRLGVDQLAIKVAQCLVKVTVD